MAWTHSGWRSQSGAAAQRAELILFMQEVDDAITAAVGDHGKNRDPTNLNDLATRLQKELDKLDTILGTNTRAPTMMSADFRGGGGR